MSCSEHRRDGGVTIVLVRSPRSCPMAPTCTTQESSSTGKEMREKGSRSSTTTCPTLRGHTATGGGEGFLVLRQVTLHCSLAA